MLLIIVYDPILLETNFIELKLLKNKIYLTNFYHSIEWTLILHETIIGIREAA